jgi:HEAT repeat protein
MTGTGTALEKALSALAEGVPLSRAALQEFSDLDPASLEVVARLWPGIPAKRKHTLLDGLHGLADESTLVSFDDLARQLLSDPDSQVRMRAIRLLGENQDPRLAAAFLKILASDDDAEARREAAAALGRFVELGELEEIPEATHQRVVDALLSKVTGEDGVAIRRRALESLGYSSKTEVATLIESSFRRENPDWQASAMVAMGLSSDERWEEHVLSRLLDENPGVRLAAVQAAGELRLGSARQLLFQVLEEEDESEVSSAAIWSLSQIGGEDARIYIQGLLDLAEEDEDVEFLEEVLENLEFTDELNRFDLLSVEPDLDD